jgi:hypothetical protein
MKSLTLKVDNLAAERVRKTHGKKRKGKDNAATRRSAEARREEGSSERLGISVDVGRYSWL